MLLQQFYQTADKFVGIGMLMHIDAAVFPEYEKQKRSFLAVTVTFPSFFVREAGNPESLVSIRLQNPLHQKKLIQGTEWIVQADGFFAKTQFCLFFFNNIKSVFFCKSSKLHTLSPYCIHVNHTTIIGIAQAHYKQNKIKEYIRKQNPTVPRQSAVRRILLLLFENARQFQNLQSTDHRCPYPGHRMPREFLLQCRFR